MSKVLLTLKIGRFEYDITSADTFMDNGNCIQLLNRRDFRHSVKSSSHVLSKLAAKKLSDFDKVLMPESDSHAKVFSILEKGAKRDVWYKTSFSYRDRATIKEVIAISVTDKRITYQYIDRDGEICNDISSSIIDSDISFFSKYKSEAIERAENWVNYCKKTHEEGISACDESLEKLADLKRGL